MAKYTDELVTSGDVRYIRIVVRGRVVDPFGVPQAVINVLHYRRDSLGSAIDMADIATLWKASFMSEWLDSLHSDYKVVAVSAEDAGNLDGPVGEDATAEVGVTAGDRLPLDNAVTVNWKTGFAGRSFRGRKHFGPISESFTTKDNLTSAASTTFDALAAVLLDTFTDTATNDWEHVILSPTLSVIGADTSSITAADVTDYSLNLRVGSMVGRKTSNQPAP